MNELGKLYAHMVRCRCPYFAVHKPLQDLDLSFCHEIPTDAWEVLETANWSNLKKASFEQRLGQEKGVEGSSCIILLLFFPDVENTSVRTFFWGGFVCDLEHAQRKETT